MNKSDLILQIIKNSNLSNREVNNCVSSIINQIKEAIKNHNRIEIRDFGSFDIKFRPERKGRNPKTGQTIEIKEKYVSIFKAGKQLRDKVNRKKMEKNT